MVDAIHLELDLLDATTLAALGACQLLPRGQYLVDVLPRPLFIRLRRHLNYVRQSLPRWLAAAGVISGGSSDESTLYAAEYLFDAIAGDWERKRPVYVLLMVNSLTESDVRARGTPVLDLYLAQEADRSGKQLAAVELVEEHCSPLNSMNLSQVCRLYVTLSTCYYILLSFFLIVFIYFILVVNLLIACFIKSPPRNMLLNIRRNYITVKPSFCIVYNDTQNNTHAVKSI